MEFNTTHPEATLLKGDIFTVYTRAHYGASDSPLPMSSSAVSLSATFTRSTVVSAIILLLSIYLSAVRYLRYQHITKVQQKYGRTPAEFSNINYKDAQAILGSLFLLDSPWIFLQAKDFAFLRVIIQIPLVFVS